ncbi:2OG-Fe(II) oxygenase [Azospirillum largimobile]
MRSLLSGVTPADIRTDPFPHIVLSDVLDEDTHRALNAGFPGFAQIGWANPRRNPGSNRRYQMSAWLIMNHPGLSRPWKDFVRRHSSPEWFAEVAALFRDHWPDDLKRALGGDLLGHEMGLILRDDFARARILMDARAEINTPVTGPPSSPRGAHLDTPNRLFTCLYYLRRPEDDTAGGDLELFRWKDGAVGGLDGFQVPADAVERVAVIPYRANRMVIFPQSIHALHGVGIRPTTPHTRQYVFISAEIAEPWLTAPAA